MEKPATKADDAFDIGALQAADTAVMFVVFNGARTKWAWTFAGPGHPKAVAQSARLARERAKREAMQEAARVNGRKWKPEAKSDDDTKVSNVEFILERLITWNTMPFNGKPYEFSPENARAILMNDSMVGLMIQALQFIGDDDAFIKGSATS